MSTKGTVLVAMSGGVDSSTTAYLLKERGYDVVGVTMRLHDDDAPGIDQSRPCCSTAMAGRAAAVCAQLGVPHYVVDFREEFKRDVMDDFYREYLAGNTPNPCVRCNTYIKWEPLVKKKQAIGADFIATGHYARVVRNETSGVCELHRGVDRSKDQSYFLWGLTGGQLAYTLFPLGELTKKEVRALAAKYELPTAETPESMEVCFIPDNDYRTFIGGRMDKDGKTASPGEFRTPAGDVIGRHNGYHNFTIGQRKKLGLSIGRKVFVSDIIPEENAVIVGDETGLLSDTLTAHSMNWINGIPESGELRCEVKIRYRDPGTPGIVEVTGESEIRVRFDEPARAVTPGQSVVLYDGDRVIAGGVISRNEDAGRIHPR